MAGAVVSSPKVSPQALKGLLPLRPKYRPRQEIAHQRGDLNRLVFQCEVAGRQGVVLGIRVVGEDLTDDLLGEYLVVRRP